MLPDRCSFVFFPLMSFLFLASLLLSSTGRLETLCCGIYSKIHSRGLEGVVLHIFCGIYIPAALSESGTDTFFGVSWRHLFADGRLLTGLKVMVHLRTLLRYLTWDTCGFIHRKDWEIDCAPSWHREEFVST